MAISFTSLTLNEQTGNSTTLTVNMPAVRPDGDLFIAICFKDDDPAWTGIPSNWIEIFQVTDGAQCRLGAWWFVGDAEPASYSLTMDSEIGVATVLRIAGARLDAPIDDFDTDTQSSIDATSPASDTTIADTLVIRAAVVDRDAITATQATERTKGGGGGAADVGYGVSTAIQASIGTTGTSVFTNASDEWVAATIVIAPFIPFTANDLSDVVFPDQNLFMGPFEI